MANVMKLKGKIAENGLTIEKTANMIGIDNSTFHRKMKNDGINFSIGEANKLVEILKLTQEEAMVIFFNDIVA